MPNASLTIFGNTYTNVAGIIATDTSDVEQTYVRAADVKPTLTMGTIRPDAQLVKTISYDKYIVADEEVTLPAYTTTAQTLKASETLTETYTVSFTDYTWYMLIRALSIPEYSVTTKAKGRVEYHTACAMYEITEFEANTISALIDPTKKVTSRSISLPSTSVLGRLVYWSSGSAIAAYSTAAYGVYQTITAPAVTAAGVITFKTPALCVRGHTTYLTSTYMNAITDIRYQWVIELYRAPKDNLNLNGWGQEQQTKHMFACVNSSTHKLT